MEKLKNDLKTNVLATGTYLAESGIQNYPRKNGSKYFSDFLEPIFKDFHVFHDFDLFPRSLNYFF